MGNVIAFRTKRLSGFIPEPRDDCVVDPAACPDPPLADYIKSAGYPEVVPFGGAGIDGMFIAPEKDPA